MAKPTLTSMLAFTIFFMVASGALSPHEHHERGDGAADALPDVYRTTSVPAF